MLVAVQLSVPGLYLAPVLSIRDKAAPDDHFTPGPHCRVKTSAGGRAGGAGGAPTICDGVISPAGVQKDAAVSAPDDHFAASPDCRVNVSGAWRAGDAGGCPTVRAGIVSPASVKEGAASTIRPRRSFRCRSTLPCARIGQRARWCCWWQSNYPYWDCIARPCQKKVLPFHPPQTIISLPVHTAV